jgi:DNA polymerase beta
MEKQISKYKIIESFEKLCELYKKDSSKRFQLKAIQESLFIIKEYAPLEIHSGEEFAQMIKEKNIKGIGKGTIDRLNEIIQTHSLKELNKENEKNNIMNLFKTITGVGDKRAEEWYESGYRSISDISQAIYEKKITSTHHIDLGLKYYEDLKERIPRDEIDKMKKKIGKIIKKMNKELIFEICGSYRRGEETSGDMDLLFTNPHDSSNYSYLKEIVEKLTEEDILIDHLTEKGEKKYMGFCKLKTNSKYKARRIDIRYFPYEEYWAGILYFTGNKEFNINLRNRALEKGYSLNEYGLKHVKTNEKKKIESEDHIFQLLEIPYKSPLERRMK